MQTLRAPVFVERLVTSSAALAKTSELLFLLVFTVVSIALTAIVSYSLEVLHISQEERAQLFKFGLTGFFVIVVVVAPVVETLLFQQLPIALGRRFKMSPSLQLAMGSIPFAALHFESGIVTGFAAGVVGGVILSLAYFTFISQSKMKAFCMTAAIHALHNLVPFVLYVRDLP